MGLRSARALLGLAVIAMLLGACADSLSAAEDDWCAAHPDAVQQAVPPNKQRDVEYRDATWKDACRHAYAAR